MIFALILAPCIFAKRHFTSNGILDGNWNVSTRTNCDEKVNVSSSHQRGIEGVYRVIAVKQERPIYQMETRHDRYLYYLDSGIWSFGSG